MDAFDADVLIYAATTGHRLGQKVRALFRAASSAGTAPVGVGSVLLLPELLSKPMRDGKQSELAALVSLLSRLDLRPTDQATAELATGLSATYRLRAADAIHLATAINAGADRFLTNDTKDFPTSITEIAITYPADLVPTIES